MHMTGRRVAREMKMVHHCVQRQPLDCANPEMTGPSAGPANY